MAEISEDLAGLVAGAAALGVALDAEQQQALATYAALLLEWNERVNLIGPAAAQALWSRHLLDALTLVVALPGGVGAGDQALSLIDVGSGAGLPGIPLQIAFPHWQITLLEATNKRVRFLEAVQQELGLANLQVVAGRAEDVAHDRDHREAYDLGVARAVTHAAALVELTLPFVVVGGSAVLYKTLPGLSEELQAAEPARVLVGAAAPVVIPAGNADEGRCLVRYRKQRRTPRPLPRKAGVPDHRPLTQADAARITADVATERARREQRHGGRRRR